MAHKHHHDTVHHHAHPHRHTHATGNIALAFFLNTAFAVIELAGGLFTNSVAILSDALHDFGDSFSLGTAWHFQRKSKKARSSTYTYGYKRFSLLGAFIHAVVLITGSIFIIREAMVRISQPQQANAKGMLLLAVLGIVVNGIAMLRLQKGSSINEKVVSLHFLEDILGWVAVLIGAIIMLFADVPILDPILSLLIAAFVLFNVYRNMKPAFRIILQGVPAAVSEEQVRELIKKYKEITGMHDFHIWTMDGEYHVLSMHIVVTRMMDLHEAQLLKEKIKHDLKHLEISHATIEVEYNPEHCEAAIADRQP
jgi:cobalt-zinc-cadmium efflux system protein